MTLVRRLPLVLVLAALAALGLVAPAGAGPTVRDQVLRGDLLRTHGVRAVCPQCDSLIVTRAKADSAPLSSADPAGYGPADFARAYDLPSGAPAARTTVAVIDAGVDPNAADDLGVYRARYGLPPCAPATGCLKLVDFRGGAQRPPATTPAGRYLSEELSVETSLDLDAVSAACPSCRLIEVALPWQDAQIDNDDSTNDFARAVRTAVGLGAKVISISYGYSSDAHNTSGTTLASFTQPGVAIVASTGDDGFNGGAHQKWPSALPGVIAVGGTTLPADGPETAWFEAGSGCESLFPAADGQPASVTARCAGRRAASDISADADPATGYAVYDSYAPFSGHPLRWGVIGGTSGSAPFVGGLFGRVGDLAGVDGPRTLYRAPASAFTDVTSGDIGGQSCGDYRGVDARLCHAAPGWDGPTGLGSPHGLAAFTTTSTGGR